MLLCTNWYIDLALKIDDNLINVHVYEDFT